LDHDRRIDGRPHVTPLVAVWMNEAILFRHQWRRTEGDEPAPYENVTLTTGRNEWDRGLDAVVEGAAQMID
jgi:hypothetical protein